MGNVFNSRKYNRHHNNDKRNKNINFKPLALAIAVAISGTLPNVANAATYSVTSTADSGTGSLRDAIAQAEVNPGPDNINFSIPSGSTIDIDTSTNGPLLISQELTITGPIAGDASSIILNGDGQNQIIKAFFPSAPGTETLTLENITLQGGSFNGSPATTLTGGGAMYVRRANLTINHGLITGNTTYGNSDDGGGGIYLVGGDLTLNNTTVSNNQTNGTSANGGGIYVNYGDATINNSTISGNTTLNKGGGLCVRYGDTLVYQSTISGNTTINLDGGGLFTRGGKTTIEHSTITNNTAATTGAGVSVDLTFAANNAVLSETILSGNIIAGGGTFDNFNDRSSTPSATLSVTNSLFGDSQMEITGTDSGNYFNLDNNPDLDPLQDNGGPTYTHLPNTNSLAIGNGGAATSLLSDQRGLGFPRTRGYITDIGAVEVQAGFFLVTELDDSGPKTLRRKIQDANAAAGDDQIIFGFSDEDVTINLTSGPLVITDTVEIKNSSSGGADVILDAGQNSRHITADFPPNSGKSIMLENLTLQNGKTINDTGGSIDVENADLILNNTIVRNNLTEGTDAAGGGISVRSGNLTLDQSTVSNNSTLISSAGGFSVVNGDATLNQSTVSGNSTSGYFGTGGGFVLRNGDVTLNQTTVSGNSTSGEYASGGGFYVDTGNIVLNQSTVTNNKANTNSAGIHIYSYTFDETQTLTLSLNNSVLSNNINSEDQTPANLSFGFYTAGVTLNVNADHSLLGTDVIPTVNNASNANLVTNNATIENDNSGLGPLQKNGGATLTHAPISGSPAIDAGNNTFAATAGFTEDQRGTGFPRVVNGIVDIGAVEAPILPNKNNVVKRAEIVKPILLAAGFEPLATTGNVYDDVAANSFNATWINRFKQENFNGACVPTAPNNFCPNDIVTKEQLAEIIVNITGSSITLGHLGIFDDVPDGSHNSPQIEALSEAGYTVGCNDNPSKYCPKEAVTIEMFNNILNAAFP